jgi:hypothetical protein
MIFPLLAESVREARESSILHAHREVAPLNVRVQIWPGHPAARARLDSIDGRFIKFSVEAHDGVAQIGTGTHVRALVELSRFNKKLDAT